MGHPTYDAPGPCRRQCPCCYADFKARIDDNRSYCKRLAGHLGAHKTVSCGHDWLEPPRESNETEPSYDPKEIVLVDLERDVPLLLLGMAGLKGAAELARFALLQRRAVEHRDEIKRAIAEAAEVRTTIWHREQVIALLRTVLHSADRVVGVLQPKEERHGRDTNSDQGDGERGT